ncbi:MAG: adenylate/guanylate cyclase domain-containing protein [Geminicoccaceae bacterium]
MERRLAAILAADMVAYSRLMEADEERTLNRLIIYRQAINKLVEDHQGRVFGTAGDSVIAEFASPVEAMRCAIEIQRDLETRNRDLANDQRMHFRIGVNLGDVMVDGGELQGDGVAVAARLEALADSGGICVSGPLFDQVDGKSDCSFEDLGAQKVKNIAKPVRIYRVTPKHSKRKGGTGDFMSPALSDKPSIAVLPFVNLSGDPAQEYFSDGITEDIITELSRFHEFYVVARNATFRYKGQSPKLRDLGRDLGVRFVVEGSVRRFRKRVRISAELIDTNTETLIWAERFDRDSEDIFAIQDEVTESVVARVDDRVKRAGTILLRSRQKVSLTAYDLVLRSRPYRTQITPSGSAEAARLLEKAITMDASCAQAYAGLAFVRAGEIEQGWARNPDVTLREAEAAATQAVALDNSDGYNHASLAYVCYLTGDFDRAVHEARVALELNPNHVNIIMTNGWISVVAGEPLVGIEHIERARRLNPNLPGFELWTLGEALLAARRYQEAIDAFLMATDPPTDINLEMAICYGYLGQEDNARDSLTRYLDLAKSELDRFPGEDPVAWRAFLERTIVRRRREDVEHFIEGARKAGLPV